KTIRSLAAYYSTNDLEFNPTQIRGSDYWNPGNGAYFYWANEEHLYTISKTLRETLGLEEPEPYDLINVRLMDHITPYQYVDDYYLEEFEPEQPPYFMQEGYEPQFGDGFDIPESNPEESIEGEDDPDAVPGGGQEPEESSEEPAGETVPEESTEQFDGGAGQDAGQGGQFDEQPAPEEYNGGTGGFEGENRSYNGV